jgi:hypothetical protein
LTPAVLSSTHRTRKGYEIFQKPSFRLPRFRRPEISRGPTLQWIREVGPPDQFWRPGLTVDSSGNILVSGSLPFGGSFVTAYDTGGSQLWWREYGNLEMIRNTVKSDSEGNIFLAGRRYHPLPDNNSHYDVALLKVSPVGDLLWTQEFGTPVEDLVYSLGLDADGNALVTGYTRGSLDAPNTTPGSADMYVRKYSSSGEFIWGRQFGSNKYDAGWEIANDATGNVFVRALTLGDAIGLESGDILSKFSGDGDLLWAKNVGVYCGCIVG